MQYLWSDVLTWGLYAAMNPGILVTATVMMLLGLWFKPRVKSVVRLLFIFLLVYWFLKTSFLMGAFFEIVESHFFRYIAGMMFKLLSVIFLAFGILFFRDWWRLSRGAEEQKLLSYRACQPRGVVTQEMNLKNMGVMAIWALGLAALCSIWPPDYRMSALVNQALLPGRFFTTSILAGIYCAAGLGLAILSIWYTSLNLRKGLILVVSSAVCLSASFACLIIH